MPAPTNGLVGASLIKKTKQPDHTRNTVWELLLPHLVKVKLSFHMAFVFE